jgi:hypothetical protein
MVLLRRRLAGIDGARLMSSMARISVASLAMGAAALLVDHGLIGALPDGRLPNEITRLAVTIACALAVLATAAFVLRIRELHLALAAVTRRVQPHD